MFAVAPRIDRRLLKNVTVREGEPVYLDVKATGEPAPEISCTHNRKTVMESERIRIERVPHNTKYFLDAPIRADTGTYVITATNQHGEDTVEIEVTVICTLTRLIIQSK